MAGDVSWNELRFVEEFDVPPPALLLEAFYDRRVYPSGVMCFCSMCEQVGCPAESCPCDAMHRRTSDANAPRACDLSGLTPTIGTLGDFQPMSDLEKRNHLIDAVKAVRFDPASMSVELLERIRAAVRRNCSVQHEGRPSAVAAAPGIQRGPVIACQSQYDPDE